MANRDAIEVKIQDKAVHQYLNQLMSKIGNAQPVMSAIAAELQSQTEWAFENEGPGWPQLASSTEKSRGSAHPILQRSTALVRSINSYASADRAVVGANTPYAAIHQFGGIIKRKGRSGTVRLRTEANGELMRQGKHGNLAVFAKKEHKRVTERSYQSEDYEIKIPARPYLPADRDGNLNPQALEAVVDILQGFLRNA